MGGYNLNIQDAYVAAAMGVPVQPGLAGPAFSYPYADLGTIGNDHFGHSEGHESHESHGGGHEGHRKGLSGKALAFLAGVAGLAGLIIWKGKGPKNAPIHTNSDGEGMFKRGWDYLKGRGSEIRTSLSERKSQRQQAAANPSGCNP